MSFTLGVNLPWVRYGGDFGANAWRPEGGLATSGDRVLVERALKDIAATGAEVVRWFLLCDGRAGIVSDERRRPMGLDSHLLRDVDTALTLASEAGVRIMFVLLDFHWCHPRRHLNGVDVGGLRRILADPDLRRRLLDTVVSPIVSRFGTHEAVWAWDIINEPEWVTRGLGTFAPWRGISADAMRGFIAAACASIREQARQPITAGLASARWLNLVRHVPLDFYQVHWYDSLDRRAPLDRPVAALDVDRPVLLGEFPTRGSHRAPDEILSLARMHGYAGAFPWSWQADDVATDSTQAAMVLSHSSRIGSRATKTPAAKTCERRV